MTGIHEFDRILVEMLRDTTPGVRGYALLMETAINDFLTRKKSFYCTNTECPLKKALVEETPAIPPTCGTCKHYRRDHHHCVLHDALTNPKYECPRCWVGKDELK